LLRDTHAQHKQLVFQGLVLQLDLEIRLSAFSCCSMKELMSVRQAAAWSPAQADWFTVWKDAKGGRSSAKKKIQTINLGRRTHVTLTVCRTGRMQQIVLRTKLISVAGDVWIRNRGWLRVPDERS